MTKKKPRRAKGEPTFDVSAGAQAEAWAQVVGPTDGPRSDDRPDAVESFRLGVQAMIEARNHLKAADFASMTGSEAQFYVTYSGDVVDMILPKMIEFLEVLNLQRKRESRRLQTDLCGLMWMQMIELDIELYRLIEPIAEWDSPAFRLATAEQANQAVQEILRLCREVIAILKRVAGCESNDSEHESNGSVKLDSSGADPVA